MDLFPDCAYDSIRNDVMSEPRWPTSGRPGTGASGHVKHLRQRQRHAALPRGGTIDGTVYAKDYTVQVNLRVSTCRIP